MTNYKKLGKIIDLGEVYLRMISEGNLIMDGDEIVFRYNKVKKQVETKGRGGWYRHTDLLSGDTSYFFCCEEVEVEDPWENPEDVSDLDPDEFDVQVQVSGKWVDVEWDDCQLVFDEGKVIGDTFTYNYYADLSNWRIR